MLNDYKINYINQLIDLYKARKSIDMSELLKITTKDSEDFESIILMFKEEGIEVVDEVVEENSDSHYYDENSDDLSENDIVLNDEFIEFTKRIEEDLSKNDIDDAKEAFTYKRGVSSLTTYLNEISSYNLLTVQEELEYARLVQEGMLAEAKLRNKRKKNVLTTNEEKELLEKIEIGVQAKDFIFNANTRLVVSIAKRYLNRGLELEDLIQEGNQGLLKAIEKFDVTKSCRMSTYFTWWIRQSIARGVADKGRDIRLPVHIVDELNRLAVKERMLSNKLHRDPTLKELATEMGYTVDKLNKLMISGHKISSLDVTIGDDEETTIEELTKDEHTDSAFEFTLKQDYKDAIDKAKKMLDEKERNVIDMRFGFKDGKSYTLDEVGKTMGVTRERIRQIERKALIKMKTLLNNYQ